MENNFKQLQSCVLHPIQLNETRYLSKVPAASCTCDKHYLDACILLLGSSIALPFVFPEYAFAFGCAKIREFQNTDVAPQ
jgi:hypothetical protein